MKNIHFFCVSLISITFSVYPYGPKQPEWRVVNDTVMGGVSSSSATPLEDGLVRFAGILSLENNGGFASIRSDSDKFAIQENGSLILKVRGDGRTYTVDLRTRRRQGAFSYKRAFMTEPDEVREIRLPLTSFRATAFGRNMPLAAQLDPREIVSFGFMLADKKPGPFRLDVLSVQFEPEPMPDVADAKTLIERSISLAVPLFNRGDADACAAIYETTAHALLMMPEQEVPKHVHDQLKKEMKDLPSPQAPAERAWALRHALNQAHQEL